MKIFWQKSNGLNRSRNWIKELVKGFCMAHLNEELTGYALKLCETLGRKRNISITRGKGEIWAAAIVYVIARLNFLFDRDNAFYLLPDTICDFFGTKKSTNSSPCSAIEIPDTVYSCCHYFSTIGTSGSPTIPQYGSAMIITTK
jgi:hypothetical protein